MAQPTAQQIIALHDELAAQQFKQTSQASLETNDRGLRTAAFGLIGGVGVCFTGTVMAIASGAIAQGGAGHYGVFLGGFAVGLAGVAAATWFTSDSVEEASVKLQATDQKLDDLLGDVAKRTDLSKDFSEVLLARRQEIAQKLAEKEELKQDAAIAFAAGAAVGAVSKGMGR